VFCNFLYTIFKNFHVSQNTLVETVVFVNGINLQGAQILFGRLRGLRNGHKLTHIFISNKNVAVGFTTLLM
jgi:hypothetical protein